MQTLANKLPYAFTDHKGVTKSHIPAADAPERVEVPQGEATNTTLTPNPRKRDRTPTASVQGSWRHPQKQKIDQNTSLPKTIQESQQEVDRIPCLNHLIH